MVTIINEHPNADKFPAETKLALDPDANESLSLATSTELTTNHLLISGKFITHNARTGLNSLVDSAAYLFSIMGKLKKIKSYRQLSKLRQELINEINVFQDVVKAQGYSSEYILASRYALCATLDDIIANTTWGTQGQWEVHSLLQAFSNHETLNQEKFFMILERIIKDPNLYIDVMEFMYICLSLGFKGNYRSTEFNHTQLEQIINALYKRIRKARGEFSKTLAPFPLKPPTVHQPKTVTNMPVWLVVVLTACIIVTLFAGVRFMLDVSSNQAYQDLTRTGKIPLYETSTTSVAR